MYLFLYTLDIDFIYFVPLGLHKTSINLIYQNSTMQFWVICVVHLAAQDASPNEVIQQLFQKAADAMKLKLVSSFGSNWDRLST